MAAWLLLFVVAPNAILIFYSFSKNHELHYITPAFTVENYARILDPVYFGIFWRSLAYAGLTTIFCVAIGYPVAWFIGRCGSAWRNRLLMLVMIPFWTSFLIRTYAWMIILREQGVLNAVLGASGAIPAIFPEPLQILYTPAAIVIGLVYSYLPFMILPIYGSVEKLDNSLVEAALDLGAGPLRAFSRIIVPLTRPGIVAGIVLVFIPSIGMFAISDLLGGKKVLMIGNVIQQQFGLANNWPFGAALGIALMGLFLGAYFLLALRRPGLR